MRQLVPFTKTTRWPIPKLPSPSFWHDPSTPDPVGERDDEACGEPDGEGTGIWAGTSSADIRGTVEPTDELKTGIEYVRVAAPAVSSAK